MGLPEVVPDVLRQRAGGAVGLVGGDEPFLVLTASALLSPGDDLVGATTHVPALGSGEVEPADTAALFSIDAEDVFAQEEVEQAMFGVIRVGGAQARGVGVADRKSTRLNSSHVSISYAVFCLKKKSNDSELTRP